MFLSKASIQRCRDLQVGNPGEPRFEMARVFMDKDQPINMSDGTPKEVSSGMSKSPGMIQDLVQMSKALPTTKFCGFLNTQYGSGAGTYLGEVVFWKKWGGVSLGKQKWEAHGQDLIPSMKMHGGDTAMLSELWDMRWVFPTCKQAAGFHADMLTASRAEDNKGYLDGMSEVAVTRSDLNELVMVQNKRKRKPKRITAEFANRPADFTSQFGIVYRVDRVVVRLYGATGVDCKQNLKQESALQLAIIASDVVNQFIDPDFIQRKPAPTPAPSTRAAFENPISLLAANVEPKLFSSFHDHASALREAAPWEAGANAQQTFTLGAEHLGAEHVVQILGSGGRHCGLVVWPSFRDYMAHRHDYNSSSQSFKRGDQSTISDPVSPCRLVELTFEDPNGELEALLADDVAHAKQLQCAVPSVKDSLHRIFPKIEVTKSGGLEPLRMKDVRIIEAAMAMTVKFFGNMVTCKPLPPPPHAIAYNFSPCSASCTYFSGFKSGKEISCSPAYPAGEIIIADCFWSSYPQAVRLSASRPSHIRTIQQAIDFHREALAACGPLIRSRVQVQNLVKRPDLNGQKGVPVSFDVPTGRYHVILQDSETPIALRPESLTLIPHELNGDLRMPGPTKVAGKVWRGHTYGLVNALWETEVVDNVKQACELAEMLLADDFDDADFVREFLLDCYLECGRWADALDLLHRYGNRGITSEQDPYPGRIATLWAWSAALIHVKKQGTKRAAAAIEAAINVNPHVYLYLTQEKEIPRQEVANAGSWFPTMVRSDGTRLSPEGDLLIAGTYVSNYRQHWWKGKKSCEEIKQTLREAGEEVYLRRKEEEVHLLLGGSATPHKDVDLPCQKKTTCANCQKISQKSSRVKMKICSRCMQVGYCSKKCQAAHWPVHMPACKRSRA